MEHANRRNVIDLLEHKNVKPAMRGRAEKHLAAGVHLGTGGVSMMPSCARKQADNVAAYAAVYKALGLDEAFEKQLLEQYRTGGKSK